MKQITQSYRTGELKLSDVPLPALESGHVLVQTAFSTVSLGTEGKKVTTARQSLLGKARSRPDLVQQVIQSARREGIVSTYGKVMNRLDEPVALGYSAAGTIIALGPGVEDLRVGDRVACGGERAAHAEVMAVPINLCAKVPDCVSLEYAAFATIGAIALQGVRQAQITLGEVVVVIGLGLVGQITAQLLKANGCRVLGIDLDPEKIVLAKKTGADEALLRHDAGVESTINALTHGFGADAVIVTAASTSSDPVRLAAELCRDRGRIIVVGDVKLDIPRDLCYYKELEIRLSRSYGPGRYDPVFEEKGIDYPIGYVRWTEQRNMEAFLDLVASGRLNLKELITHRFPFDEAEQAYAMLSGDHHDGPAPLGVVLEYDLSKEHMTPTASRVYSTVSRRGAAKAGQSTTGIGFIGAGSFARKHLIPPLTKDPRIQLVGVSTATGMSGQNTAEKFGFAYSTGDYRQILEDPGIEAVFIATRHNLHASLVAATLESGKAAFVEKPLALSEVELDEIIAAHQQNAILMVGFNRRFAALTKQMGALFSDRAEPMVVHYRVNAGFIEGKHWVHDAEQGGGRILGEVCHFIDLISFLVNRPLCSVYAVSMDNAGRYHNDNVSLTLQFSDGSLGNVLYLANGDAAMPKERIEVFCQGSTAVVDDFRHLELYRRGRRKTKKSAQDKGHSAEVLAFVKAVRDGGPSPIPFDEIVLSTSATIKSLESLQTGAPVPIPIFRSPEPESSGS
jgi:predicted dehydrogenase/threonine dehydrogenase-like Zn-dependent dehydrogenase